MKLNITVNDLSAIFNIKPHIARQVLAALPCYLFFLCFGISFNVSAVLLPQLREDKTIKYEASHESWIASINSISMVIGSLGSGQVMDRYGRKIAHIAMGLPYIIGWIIIINAPSTSIIILGRFFTGLSSGTVRTVLYVYIGEIVCPKNRAMALVLPSILFCIGTIMSHVIAHYFQWGICGIICISLSIVVAISSIFLKESPIWMIAQGKRDEGSELFRWFRGDDSDTENELNAILSSQINSSDKSSNTFKVLMSSAFLKPMLTLLVVMVNVQCSGINAIGFYAQDIFETTFSGKLNSFLIMLVMDGVVSLISVLICCLGKYIPKKKLFLASNFGVAIFVSGLVACLLSSYKSIWLPVLCLVIFLCFATFVLNIGWTFVPELLPSSVRGLGSGINSALSYILLFLVAKLTPAIISSCGVSVVFALFGILSLICGVILCFILPDTDGKTLQSIEDTYNKTIVETI